MKSLKNLINSSKNALINFPFEMICLFLSTIIVLYLINWWDITSFDQNFMIKIVMMCVLWFNMFLWLSIYDKNNNMKFVHKILINIIILSILVGYFIYLPSKIEDVIVENLRYGLFLIVAISLVLLMPYIKNYFDKWIWNYSKELISRLLVSWFFSAVMFVWLAVFLVALDYLFWININEKIYMSLATIMFWLFLFWFFLWWIPSDFKQFESEYFYNKFIKVFSQYVLIFLTWLYLILLYAYWIKILITWNWPSWWVVWLTIWFFVVSLWTFILLKPLIESQDWKWVTKYIRYFSILSLPVLWLYFHAIYFRIDDYGFTINRYFVILIWIWIFVVYVYNIFSSKHNIRYYLISFVIFTLFSSIWPWWVISFTKNYQYKSLVNELENQQMLQNGKLYKINKKITYEQYSKIEWKIDYLVSIYGAGTLDDLYSQDLKNIVYDKDVTNYTISNSILEYMWISSDQKSNSRYNYFNFYSPDSSKDLKPLIFDISWFDYMFDLSLYEKTNKITLDSNIYYDYFDWKLIIWKDENSLEFDINKKIEELIEKKWSSWYQTLNSEEMLVELSNDWFKIKIIIKSINWELKQNKPQINSIELKILM